MKYQYNTLSGVLSYCRRQSGPPTILGQIDPRIYGLGLCLSSESQKDIVAPQKPNSEEVSTFVRKKRMTSTRNWNFRPQGIKTPILIRGGAALARRLEVGSSHLASSTSDATRSLRKLRVVLLILNQIELYSNLVDHRRTVNSTGSTGNARRTIV